MFNSLNLIKNFSKDTLIYFGHEYTLQNSKFCIYHEPENSKLKDKILQITQKLKNNISTTPTNLEDELDCNIFLRCNENVIKQALNLKDALEQEIFTKLRDLKDAF